MTEGQGPDSNREGYKKIKIGRLHVDPVFLLLFLFFTISSFLMVFFVWLAS